VISANGVLPFLVKTKLTTWLAGLLTAGILAAIMSSLDSQFLCVGSMFTNDIVEHYVGKERVSDTASVWIARGFVILVVAVTYYLSLKGYKSVFTLGVWCFSGFASLFPLVFASLYWKRLTAAGALSGVLAMVGSWLYLFRDSGWGANRSYAINVPIGEGAEIMPVVAIFLCTLVAMVATSLITNPPSDKTLAKFFN
jgi:SSS family solute:Na+ symporter